jgi:hypothetical protein
MDNNNFFLAKLADFLDKQADTHLKWSEVPKTGKFTGFLSNIVRGVSSWILAGLLCFVVHENLPKSIPIDLGKLIAGGCYFGSFVFFMYFPFQKNIKKLKDRFFPPRKMEELIEHIGQDEAREKE